MTLSETLMEYLLKVQNECNKLKKSLMNKLHKELKPTNDYMKKLHQEQMIYDMTEEIVLQEIIYQM